MKAGIQDRRAQVRVAWVPSHRGTPGNEVADCWAADEAQRADRLEKAWRKHRGTAVGGGRRA